jgi:hypothetical protein
VPKLKKSLKTQQIGFLSAKKKFTVSISDSYFSKMEQKNPERAARDFGKSTFN